MLPRLSKDHSPGSVTLSVLAAGDPHPVQLEVLVTVAPFKCEDLVDPLAAVSYTHLTLPTNREV